MQPMILLFLFNNFPVPFVVCVKNRYNTLKEPNMA